MGEVMLDYVFHKEVLREGCNLLTFVAESCLVLSEAFQSNALADHVEELVEGGPPLLVVVHLLLRLLPRPAVHHAHLQERVFSTSSHTLECYCQFISYATPGSLITPNERQTKPNFCQTWGFRKVHL